MAQQKNYPGSVVDRLERLPFTRKHLEFLLLVMAGEWVETMLLLGNGTIAALLSKTVGLTIAVTVTTVSFFLGETVGSIFFGRLADLFGRKTVFQYDLLMFGISSILAGFMNNLYAVAALIFISGIGVGGEFPVVDTYISEMMPARIRGRSAAFAYTLQVTAAPLIAYIAYISSSLGYYSWRVPLWVMGVAAIVVWGLRFVLDESPRWLEIKGRYEDADKIVRKWEEWAMKHSKTPLPEPVYRTEIKEEKSSYSELFSDKELRKRVIMMMVFQFFQTGLFYGFTALVPSFLVKKGITLAHSLLFTMIIYSGFIFGSLLNIFIIDRVQRKYGIISAAIIAGILGTAFAFSNSNLLTVTFGFLVAFTLWNFSNFFHVYQAEIFPTRVRPTAAGLTYSISRFSTSILTLLITIFFLPRGLPAVFGIIWVFIAIVALDIGIFGPRTTRKKLEEIAK